MRIINMYKKILYIGALLLSLNGFALAEEILANNSIVDSDGYTNVGGSGGLGSDSVNSYNPGIYFGGQAGISNLHYSGSQYTLPRNSYDNSLSFAARGFLGYSFSQFISAELGYDYYGRPKFKDNLTGNTQDILQQGIDLVIKASLPLDYGFGIYLKGGMAWVHRSALNANSGSFVSKDANDKFAPVGAIGINYWFTPNMAFDLCWTKTVTVSDLPTADLFTAGLIYKINI